MEKEIKTKEQIIKELREQATNHEMFPDIAEEALLKNADKIFEEQYYEDCPICNNKTNINQLIECEECGEKVCGSCGESVYVCSNCRG